MMRKESETSNSYDQIPDRGFRGGCRINVAVLGRRLREQPVGHAVPLRDVCHQHYGFVSNRSNYDSARRESALESQLAIPTRGWILGRIQHVFVF